MMKPLYCVRLIMVGAFAAALAPWSFAFEQQQELGGNSGSMSADCFDNCSVALVPIDSDSTNILLKRDGAVVAADLVAAPLDGGELSAPPPPPDGNGFRHTDYHEYGFDEQGNPGWWSVNITWRYSGGFLRGVEVRKDFDPDNLKFPCNSPECGDGGGDGGG